MASEEFIVDYETFSYRRETQRFLRNLPRYTQEYLVNLFPIARWIHRYNLLVKFLVLAFHNKRKYNVFGCIIVATP